MQWNSDGVESMWVKIGSLEPCDPDKEYYNSRVDYVEVLGKFVRRFISENDCINLNLAEQKAVELWRALKDHKDEVLQVLVHQMTPKEVMLNEIQKLAFKLIIENEPSTVTAKILQNLIDLYHGNPLANLGMIPKNILAKILMSMWIHGEITDRFEEILKYLGGE